MQIPLSAYSVGTVALNLQGVNPQVIRNAVQPLALRKSKHVGPLFFAVTQRGKSYSILILNLVCRYPPGSWEGGTADTLRMALSPQVSKICLQSLLTKAFGGRLFRSSHGEQSGSGGGLLGLLKVHP